MRDVPPLADGPSAKELGGTGLAASARRAFLATRPKFFTASVLPVLVGTAWAGSEHHAFHLLWFALALLATVLAHAASNVYNDVGDDVNGTDSANATRIYPYTGGSRFIQNGIMTRVDMRRLAFGLACAAMVLGVLLIFLRGPGVLVLGLVGLALGLCYSLPGVQLAGRGAGELAVAIGLGALPVCGAAWLQAGRIDDGVLPAAGMVSIWVALILLINEVPDATADAGAGKRTLAVRLGEGGVRVLYVLLTIGALGAGCALVARHELQQWILLPLLLLTVGGIAAARGISLHPERRAALKQSIERTLGIHMVGCVLLVIAILVR